MGTPLLLMIDTAVCLPSWACQWPMPARLVILLNRQLRASLVYMRPSSWQNTRLLSCHAAPAASRSAAWRFLCAWSTVTARLGSTRVAARLRTVEQAYRTVIDHDEGFTPPEPTRAHRSAEYAAD